MQYLDSFSNKFWEISIILFVHFRKGLNNLITIIYIISKSLQIKIKLLMRFPYCKINKKEKSKWVWKKLCRCCLLLSFFWKYLITHTVISLDLHTLKFWFSSLLAFFYLFFFGLSYLRAKKKLWYENQEILRYYICI